MWGIRVVWSSCISRRVIRCSRDSRPHRCDGFWCRWLWATMGHNKPTWIGWWNPQSGCESRRRPFWNGGWNHPIFLPNCTLHHQQNRRRIDRSGAFAWIECGYIWRTTWWSPRYRRCPRRESMDRSSCIGRRRTSNTRVGRNRVVRQLAPLSFGDRGRWNASAKGCRQCAAHPYFSET